MTACLGQFLAATVCALDECTLLKDCQLEIQFLFIFSCKQLLIICPQVIANSFMPFFSVKF